MLNHKDYENIIMIIRIISQDITKSFEESRGLWSSRISTLHGTRTVGCQWAQTVAQLGDTDSGWYLDSAIYFIGKNNIYIYKAYMGLIIIQDTIPNITTIFPIWILGMAHWLQEQMSWILHPLEITVCPRKCARPIKVPKRRGSFPKHHFSWGLWRPLVLGSVSILVKHRIAPLNGRFQRLTLRLVKQDTGYTPRLQLPFRFRSTI